MGKCLSPLARLSGKKAEMYQSPVRQLHLNSAVGRKGHPAATEIRTSPDQAGRNQSTDVMGLPRPAQQEGYAARLFTQADIDAVSFEETLAYSPSNDIKCWASRFFPANANSTTCAAV